MNTALHYSNSKWQFEDHAHYCMWEVAGLLESFNTQFVSAEEGNTLADEIFPDFLRDSHHATQSYEPIEKHKDLPEKTEVTLIDLTDDKVVHDIRSSVSLPQSPELISITDSPEPERESCVDSASICSLESESPLDILEPDYEVIDVDSHVEKSRHSNTALLGSEDHSCKSEIKTKEDANVTANQTSSPRKEPLQEIIEIGDDSGSEEGRLSHLHMLLKLKSFCFMHPISPYP